MRCWVFREVEITTMVRNSCPIVTMNDGYTIDLGEVIASTIEETLGAAPHVIINHLKR